jgi:hypothetical protein
MILIFIKLLPAPLESRAMGLAKLFPSLGNLTCFIFRGEGLASRHYLHDAIDGGPDHS